MVYLLKNIYSEVTLLSNLGFKGGTCAYFLYGLPRFSVDLDFDLVGGKREEIYKSLKNIVEEYGEILDYAEKRNTLLFELSYGKGDRNIKIEVSTRKQDFDLSTKYEMKEFLGISVLAAKKSYLFSGKLYALTNRSTPTARDVFDLHYFMKNQWSLDIDALEIWVGKDLKMYFDKCVDVVKEFNEKNIMFGLGDMVEEQRKDWLKRDLIDETIFYLESYKEMVI